MDFAGLNMIAVVCAAIASLFFGFVWYNIFGEPWMEVIGKSEEEIKSSGLPFAVLLVITFGAQLVMSWVLAGLIGHLGSGQVTVNNGLVSGAFVWLGFVFTTMVVNYGYQGARGKLTLIDSGHWLVVLLLQGAIIGSFGV